mgnify:CR=1 FL=1
MLRVKLDVTFDAGSRIRIDTTVPTILDAIQLIMSIADNFCIEQMPEKELTLLIFRSEQESDVSNNRESKVAAACGSIEPWFSEN